MSDFQNIKVTLIEPDANFAPNGIAYFKDLTELFTSPLFEMLGVEDKIERQHPAVAQIAMGIPASTDITEHAAKEFYDYCGNPDLTDTLEGWPPLFSEQLDVFLADELHAWKEYHESGSIAPDGSYYDRDELREMYQAAVL